HSILDHPERTKYDLSSLRVAVTGAADIPVELIRRINDELPFSVVITGYGLTETGTATSTSPDDDFETVATTVGRPRTGFDIGIPDERMGEVGMAFVVTGSADGESILAWCREQMANYKVPRKIEIVDELPMNATGKVVKDELRKRVAGS